MGEPMIDPNAEPNHVAPNAAGADGANAGASAFAALSVGELEAQISELTGHLSAATHRWLMLIAEFDRRNGWGDGATASCAHWLSWKYGLNLGAAREKMRVAHALGTLPLISGAMAEGKLSYSKVRALTRVATPAIEADLLMIALHGTAHHVETVVRQYRRAQHSAQLDREARQVNERQLSYFYDEDGALVVHARLPAEMGAVLVKALQAATEQFWRADARGCACGCGGVSVHEGGNVSAETRPADCAPAMSADADATAGGSTGSNAKPAAQPKPTLSQRRADALALFAESYLKHGYEALSGGERQQIVIHVDAQTLANADQPGRCELEDGPALANETARRLACDAGVVRIVEDDEGEPLSVGRKTRSIAPSIRRALRARDRHCRFPGCSHANYLDGHHIQHWADGGQTKLSNLVLLCRFHHRQVHEGRVSIEALDDGALRFVSAHGQPFDVAPPTQGDADALARWHRREGVHIDTSTAATRWAGESMDYGIAIDALCAQQRRAAERQNVSAES